MQDIFNNFSIIRSREESPCRFAHLVVVRFDMPDPGYDLLRRVPLDAVARPRVTDRITQAGDVPSEHRDAESGILVDFVWRAEDVIHVLRRIIRQPDVRVAGHLEMLGRGAEGEIDDIGVDAQQPVQLVVKRSA